MSFGSVLNPFVFLGNEVRIRREEKGWYQKDLAQNALTTRQIISQVETGNGIQLDTLKLIDSALNCGGYLVRYLKTHVLEADLSDWFDGWIEIEKLARVLRIYHPFLMPGLLQTELYARELLASIKDKDKLEKYVKTRMDRKQILAPDNDLELYVLLDEHVLYWEMGEPELMVEQMSYLLEITADPRFSVQIVPKGARGYPGLRAQLDVAEYRGGADCYLETAVRGLVVKTINMVDEARSTWDQIRSHALPEAQSIERIKEAREEWISNG